MRHVEGIVLYLLFLAAIPLLARIPYWILDYVADDVLIEQSLRQVRREQGLLGQPADPGEGMVACPTCGLPNEEEYAYCKSCRGRLPDG